MSNYQSRTGSVQCPHCREVCLREECEIITHTAVQQWDLLLDISRQWAAVDIGGMDIRDDDDDGGGGGDKDGSMDDGSVAAAEGTVKTPARDSASEWPSALAHQKLLGRR